jgi:hypothetical protein
VATDVRFDVDQEERAMSATPATPASMTTPVRLEILMGGLAFDAGSFAAATAEVF